LRLATGAAGHARFFKPNAPAAPPVSRQHDRALYAKHTKRRIQRTVAAFDHMIPITEQSRRQ
jgi:hypothetical protein